MPASFAIAVLQAQHRLASRRLARLAMERGDSASVRLHLGAARRAALAVRRIADECLADLEAEAWAAERAALPGPEVSDSDFGAFLDAQEDQQP